MMTKLSIEHEIEEGRRRSHDKKIAMYDDIIRLCVWIAVTALATCVLLTLLGCVPIDANIRVFDEPAARAFAETIVDGVGDVVTQLLSPAPAPPPIESGMGTGNWGDIALATLYVANQYRKKLKNGGKP